MRSLILCLGFALLNFVGFAQLIVSPSAGSQNAAVPLTMFGNTSRLQLLYTPADFDFPYQSGLIHKLYFRAGTTISGNNNFQNPSIRLGLTSDTIFGTTTFYSGLATTFTRGFYSYPLAINALDWLEFTLDTPFFYRSEQTLIVEFTSLSSQSGVRGWSATVPGRRLTSRTIFDSTGTIDSMQWNIGFTPVPIANQDASVDSLLTPGLNLINGSSLIVRVRIQNWGADTLRQLQMHYQYNQNPVVSETWFGSLAPVHRDYFTFNTPLLINSNQDVLKVWSSLPNGLTDTLNHNDTLTSTLCQTIGNVTLTVGDANSNYPTIDHALANLACRGMTGPVTLLLANGLYPQMLEIPVISGQSATNTLTITSASGKADSVIFQTSQNPSLSIINRTGLIFRQITFQRTGRQFYQIGNVILQDASHIRFDSCRFILDRISTHNDWSTQHNITLNRFSQIEIVNSQLQHGYFGVQVLNTTGNRNTGLRIDSNFFNRQTTGFLLLMNSRDMIIRNNIFASDTLYRGTQSYFQFTNSENLLFESNKVSGIFYETLVSIGELYTINGGTNLFANNLFKCRLSQSAKALVVANKFLSQPSLPGSIEFSHNSFDLIFIGNPTGALVFLDIDGYAAINAGSSRFLFMNNAVRLIGGHLYGCRIIKTNTSSLVQFKHNVFDHDFLTHAVVGSTEYSLASFKGLGLDSGSVNNYIHYNQQTLMPLSSTLNNLGAPNYLVIRDINGVVRSTISPDVGAYEYTGFQTTNFRVPYWYNTDTINNRNTILSFDDSLAVRQCRLWYKRQRDSSWTFTDGNLTGFNQFLMTLDLRKLNGRTKPNDTLLYYFTVVSYNNQISSFPVGGDSISAPSSPAHFVFGQSFAGIYTIGQGANRDYPSITAAMNALEGALIGDSTWFLLCDSVYPNDTFPIIISGSNLSDTSKTIVLQPAENVQIHFQRTANSNQSFFILRGTHNFILDGRSPDGSGQISFTEHSNLTLNLLHILPFGRNSINSGFKNCILRSTAPVNSISGIAMTSFSTGNVYNTIIQGNQIIGCLNGILFEGPNNYTIRDAEISENRISGNIGQHSATSIGININVGTETKIFKNHIQLIANTALFTAGIKIGSFAGSTQIYNNLIHDIKNTDTVRTGIAVFGIQISNSYCLIYGNQIYNLSVINKSTSALQTARICGIEYTGPTPPAIYHNTIYLTGNYTNPAQQIHAFNHYYLNNNIQNNKLDIKNNLLVNQVFSASRPIKTAIYGFNTLIEAESRLSLDNNVYVFYNDTNRYFSLEINSPFRVISDFNAWRVPKLLNRPEFDGQSIVLDNITGALFTQSPLLYPDSSLIRKINGRARLLPISMPNQQDYLQNIRPGFGETLPDPGALEVGPTDQLDAQAPELDSVWMSLPEVACLDNIRNIYTSFNDSSGIDSVWLVTSCNNQREVFRMNKDTIVGELSYWSISLPLSIADRWCSSFIIARDSVENLKWYIGPDFHDFKLEVDNLRDTLIISNSSLLLEPDVKKLYSIGFSEFYPVLYNYPPPDSSGTTIMAYSMSSIAEIANWGNDTLDLAGVSYSVLPSTAKFTFPANTRIPPGGVAVLYETGAPSIPQQLYFRTGIGMQFPFSARGAVLYNPQGRIIDAVALNGYTFPASSSVDNNHWLTGNSVTVNSSVGAQLAGLDLNNNRNWVNTATLPHSIGIFQNSLVRYSAVQGNWSGSISSAGYNLFLPNIAAGIYHLQFNSSFQGCTRSDSIVVHVSGADTNDFIPPFISGYTLSPNFYSNCPGQSRYIDITARDSANGSGVSHVQLLVTDRYANSQLLNFGRFSGNDTNGVYRVFVPEPYTGGMYYLQANAVDSNNLISDTLKLPFIQDKELSVKIIGDTNVISGTPTTMRAQGNQAARFNLQISEIVFFYHSPLGSELQPYSSFPSGIPTALNFGVDFFEITNFGLDSMNTANIRLLVRWSTSNVLLNYLLPDLKLASGESIILISSFGQDVPANRLFYLNHGDLLSSAGSFGIMLRDERVDSVISAVSTNSFNFTPQDRVPAHIWTGSGVTGLLNRAGIHRISAKPATTASWRVTSTTHPTNIGYAPPLQWPFPVRWKLNGVNQGVSDTLLVQISQNTLVEASIDGFNCTITDSLQINSIPLQPNLELLQLSGPLSGINNPQTPITIQYRNVGNVAMQNIPFGYSINGAQPIVQTDRNTLLPGDTATFTFDSSWTPTVGGTHNICVFGSLAGDVQSSNDTVCITAGGLITQPNVRLSRLISPDPDSPHYQASLVRILLKNEGNVDLQHFTLSYRVDNGVAITENWTQLIPIGDSAIFTFSQPWIASRTGLIDFCALAEISGDVDTTDNHRCIQLISNVVLPNLAIQRLISPSVDSVYNDSVAVRTSILNLGNSIIQGIQFGFQTNNGSWLFENWSGQLLPNDSLNYNFQNKWLAPNASIVDFCVRAITPNDLDSLDNQLCVQINSNVGFSIFSKSSFTRIFPNPAKNQIFIRFDSPRYLQVVRLTNAEGQIVKTYHLNDRMAQTELDVSGLAPGTYHLIIKAEDLTEHRLLIITP